MARNTNNTAQFTRTVGDKFGENAGRGYKKGLGWVTMFATAAAVATWKGIKDAGEHLDKFDSVQEHYNTNKSSIRLGQEVGARAYDNAMESLFGDKPKPQPTNKPVEEQAQ